MLSEREKFRQRVTQLQESNVDVLAVNTKTGYRVIEGLNDGLIQTINMIESNMSENTNEVFWAEMNDLLDSYFK